MTGVSPWSAPPETGPQQAPVYPPPPASVPPQSGPPFPPVAPPPRPPRRLRWLLIGGVVVLLIAVIAATAAVTYAVARNTNAPNTTPLTATPASQQFSAADQAAAKKQLCHIFDVSAGDQRGRGGMRVNGDVNVPLLLRTVNSAVAVQNALTPAVPEEVAQPAHRYIDSTLEMTSAAAGTSPAEELNRLTDEANNAVYALVDACGLPR
jgi:hypothetical protein